MFFNFKKAENGQNLLENIVSELNDAVIAYDNDFKIFLFNKAAESVFNLRPSEVLGEKFSVDRAKEPHYKLLVQVLFPSLAPTVIRRSENGQEPQVVDLVFSEANVDLRVIAKKIRDTSGKDIGFVKVISNRTRELAVLQSKNEFINVASHELRTPLTAVKWAMDNISKEKLSEPGRVTLEAGLRAAEKLKNIVDDLLNVARIEEGRFGYSFQKSDLVAFAEKILQDALPIAEAYGVKLYFDKPQEKIEVSIDTDRLGLALTNLLDNAIKYNVPNGAVTMRIQRVPNHPFVQVSIKDTGIGIPPEDVGKIFQKFYRADNVKQLKTEGSGLGLYMVKNIVMRHGGRIWAESILNRGTTFYFTLPTDESLIPVKEVAFE